MRVLCALILGITLGVPQIAVADSTVGDSSSSPYGYPRYVMTTTEYVTEGKTILKTSVKPVTLHDATTETVSREATKTLHDTTTKVVTKTESAAPSYYAGTIKTVHDTTTKVVTTTESAGPSYYNSKTVTEHETETVHDTHVVTKTESGPTVYGEKTITTTRPASTQYVTKTQTESIKGMETTITSYDTKMISTTATEKESFTTTQRSTITSVSEKDVVTTKIVSGKITTLTTRVPTTIYKTKQIVYTTTKPAETMTEHDTKSITVIEKSIYTSVSTKKVPVTVSESGSTKTMISASPTTIRITKDVTKTVLKPTTVSGSEGPVMPASTVTSTMREVEYSTVVEEKGYTTTSVKEVTRTMSKSGEIRTVTTVSPITMMVTEHETLIKQGPTIVSTYRAPASTIVKTFTMHGKTFTSTEVVDKTTTAPPKTITIISERPASTVTHNRTFTAIETYTKGQTIVLSSTTTILASPVTSEVVKTSCVTTTIPASTITSVSVHITQLPASTVTYVTRIPASTITATSVYTSVSTCKEGETVTLPRGSTTILVSASPTTIVSTSLEYKTLPASTQVVTQLGSTIYRDVLCTSTTTYTSGQTVTIDGSTSVFPTDHITTYETNAVTSYVIETTSANMAETPTPITITRTFATTSPISIPTIFPQCITSVLASTTCNGVTDCECYCKSASYISSIVNCIASSSGTESEIQQAVSYLQGICARLVPSNPAIITAVPSTITQDQTISNLPYTTISLLTTLTEACTDVKCAGSSITKTVSSVVTAPAVAFYTPAGGVATGQIVPAVATHVVVVSTPEPSDYGVAATSTGLLGFTGGAERMNARGALEGLLGALVFGFILL